MTQNPFTNGVCSTNFKQNFSDHAWNLFAGAYRIMQAEKAFETLI